MVIVGSRVKSPSRGVKLFNVKLCPVPLIDISASVEINITVGFRLVLSKSSMLKVRSG